MLVEWTVLKWISGSSTPEFSRERKFMRRPGSEARRGFFAVFHANEKLHVYRYIFPGWRKSLLWFFQSRFVYGQALRKQSANNRKNLSHRRYLMPRVIHPADAFFVNVIFLFSFFFFFGGSRSFPFYFLYVFFFSRSTRRLWLFSVASRP